MRTNIYDFVGEDLWVYAELDEFGYDAYIRIVYIDEDTGDLIFNAYLPSDSYGDYDIDEILYGELTSNVDSIEIHPLDTITTDELIDMVDL